MFTADVITLRDLSLPIRARHSGPCGPYYFKPAALRTRGPSPGFGGYLSDDESEVSEGSACRLRVQGWADELAGDIGLRDISRRTGWYCDEHEDETMRGLVLRLPHGRGYLAGWSMGAGMCSSFDGTVYETVRDAVIAADEEARIAAEREREYQAEERERERDEEREIEANERD